MESGGTTVATGPFPAVLSVGELDMPKKDCEYEAVENEKININFSVIRKITPGGNKVFITGSLFFGYWIMYKIRVSTNEMQEQNHFK